MNDIEIVRLPRGKHSCCAQHQGRCCKCCKKPGEGVEVLPAAGHIRPSREAGKKPWHAAEIEALEEAGAVGHIGKDSLGTYHYNKDMDDGSELYCAVDVFPMIVDKLKRRWKERDERKRRWFSPAKAAKLVKEDELSALLKQLSKMPDKPKTLLKLVNA